MAEAALSKTARTPATNSYPWVLIGLLWLVAFLNAADRNILIAVLPQLKVEFGLSNNQLAFSSGFTRSEPLSPAGLATA